MTGNCFSITLLPKNVIIVFSLFICITSFSQTNIVFTNSLSEQIIKGNFNPSTYLSSTPLNQHNEVVSYIQNNVNPDSLKSYILKLASFENRNTASDTVSLTTGIGAARRCGHIKNFQVLVSKPKTD
jgi:hypothetical protein